MLVTENEGRPDNLGTIFVEASPDGAHSFLVVRRDFDLLVDLVVIEVLVLVSGHRELRDKQLNLRRGLVVDAVYYFFDLLLVVALVLMHVIWTEKTRKMLMGDV